jgi:Skp family chaperone for outer membrane proteins
MGMRGRLRQRARGAALLGLLGAAAMAQDAPVPGLPPPAEGQPPPVTDGRGIVGTMVLTLDQERFFLESAFGKASLDRERVATQALDVENKQIEAALIAEEQDLTTRRETLPAAEFATLATAFDEKVERIRTEQDAKARTLTRARDEDRQAFLRAAVPVLGELMGEKGAVAILEKSNVILSLTAIDVTEEAIARVDAVLPLDAPPPANP